MGNKITNLSIIISTWRNINDPQFIIANKIALIGRVLSGPNYIKIILAARKQIKNIKLQSIFTNLQIEKYLINLKYSFRFYLE